MKKNYYYYESSLRDDLKNCHKIKSFKKRESLIMGGASIVGMTIYGILQNRGMDCLESTYPMMALYLSAYLEGIYHLRQLFQSKQNIDDLTEMVDEKEPNKVYELLINSDLSTTRCETSSNNEPIRKIRKEEYSQDGEVFISQEYNEQYDKFGHKYVENGLYTYPKTLRKILGN